MCDIVTLSVTARGGFEAALSGTVREPLARMTKNFPADSCRGPSEFWAALPLTVLISTSYSISGPSMAAYIDFKTQPWLFTFYAQK